MSVKMQQMPMMWCRILFFNIIQPTDNLKITIKDSDFSSELKNILDEQFNPERPNAVWCSDITYIWTIDGFVYLTSIMDLYSRKIIAWTLSKTLEGDGIEKAVNKKRECIAKKNKTNFEPIPHF